MTRYAEHTQVPSSRSRDEIERTLQRYGATAFAYGWDHKAVPPVATIMFNIGVPNGYRSIRFRLPMPDRNAREFTRTPGNRRERTASAAAEAYDKATRQRWRALALVVKAKLEAVAAGISTIEEEFMAHVVLPNGSTVGEWAAPQLDAVYADGGRRMPALMPGGER